MPLPTNGPSPLPKVTIIVPTYEQDDLVLDAVRSALAQDYANLEVLVADDASPTAKYAEIRAIEDPRLRVYRNERNLGRVANYRHCLYDLAQGDWVVNLDGDDFYTDPSFVSTAIEVALSDPEIVIVSARCSTWNRHSRICSASPGARTMSGIDVVAALPDPAYLFMHLSTLYRRADAMSADFYRVPVISADWECLYRLALRGRVAFVDRDVGVWRVHGANASSSGDWRALARNLEIWPSIFVAAKKSGLPAARADTICRKCLTRFGRMHMISALRSSDRMAVLRYVLALWVLDRRATLRALASFGTLARLVAGLLGYYREKTI